MSTTTERITVTEKDLKRYEQDGYWKSPKLISDEQIAQLRAAHERLWAGDFDGDGYPRHPPSIKREYDPEALRKCDNGWWINDAIRDVVTSPLIGRLAAALMRTPEVRLWHDQVIWKPGLGAGGTSAAGNVGWHQDFGYWRCSSTTNMCTVWIALQDTDLSNGGMRSIAGSHKWGVLEGSDTFFDTDMDALQKRYADGREWRDEPCILKAGQASFHHALTLHGSGPNMTDEPRLSVVAHLMPADCAYRPGVRYHPNIPLLGPRPVAGQLLEGPYFPVLHKQEG